MKPKLQHTHQPLPDLGLEVLYSRNKNKNNNNDKKIYVTTSESRHLTLNASGFKDRTDGQIIIIILTDFIHHCTAICILYFNKATRKRHCHHVTRGSLRHGSKSKIVFSIITGFCNLPFIFI